MAKKPNILKRRDAFLTCVRVCMARRGIKNARELAPLVGIDERNLYRRMRYESHWTLDELWRLLDALQPNDDELKEMMGR